MQADRLTIAYVTSVYARATDSFIRGEVRELRRLGHRLLTYSVRRPALSEVVGSDIRAEYDATTYLLDVGAGGLALASLRHLVRHPRRFLKTLRLAVSTTAQGLRGRIWPVFYFMEACVLADHLRREGVDHLHDHIGEGSAFVAMLASALSSVPFSFTIHGPGEWDHPDRLALGTKVARASFVIAISEHTRGQILRWSPTETWTKVYVVHCGVDSQRFQDACHPLENTNRFVAIGRLAPEKGQMVLIEAMSDAKSRGAVVELVLVGDGPERPRLQRRVRDLHLEDQVTFAGWATSDEVREHICLSRALIMPSFAEGLPVVIMEALALGRPVLSTSVGAIPELVEPGKSGWLVAPGSVSQLSAAIEIALRTDATELARLGEEGARRVREAYDARTEASKISSLIIAARRGLRVTQIP
jgi:colanic acid/amylovoran biosynthesis glycosyltransferase